MAKGQPERALQADGLGGIEAGEDSEADGGDTVWLRPQQPAQDSLAHASAALTDAIQYPGQLQGVPRFEGH